MRTLNACLFATAAMLSVAAFASPPQLVDSTPADGGISTRPAALRLDFDQPVAVEGASFDLQMTTMPGMTMKEPMRTGFAATAATNDGKSLIVTLRMPLPAGTYAMIWQVGNAAGEQGTGVYNFAVR